MARTGRFGRQFREATDLTASIVALYERYERQREEVIFDAWAKGGEFEGRPVTDQRLLNFIKDRRDSLDKSDPLWAEWDNRLGQYQFNIDDQQNAIAHAEAIAAASAIRNPRARAAAMNAANAGRAAFFRQQAQLHPRNSAAYRDLMLKSAQFSRVQQVARSSADKLSELDKFKNQYYGIYEEKIKPAETIIDAVEMFAVKNGFLTANEAQQRGGLWMLNTSEFGNLHDLLSGLQESEEWPQVRRMLHRFVPGWDGNLDPGDFHRISHVALQGVNEQIRLAKSQKGDYRYYIDLSKGQRSFLQRVSTLDRRLSIFDRYNEANDRWGTAYANSPDDPFDRAEADKELFDELNRLKKKALSGGGRDPAMLELWASLDVESKILIGDVDGLKGTSAVPLYVSAEGYSGGASMPEGGGGTFAEERAREKKDQLDQMSGLVAGTHVYVPIGTGSSVEQQQTQPLGGAVPGYEIQELTFDDITGRPRLDPNQVLAPMSFSGGSYMGADGKMVQLPQGAFSAVVTLKQVYGYLIDPETGKYFPQPQPIGEVGYHQGAPLFRMRSTHEPIAGQGADPDWLVYGQLDRWLGVDAQLTPTSDGGYLLAPQNPMDTAAQETMRTALTAVEDRTPGSVLETMRTPVQPEVGSPPTFNREGDYNALAESVERGRGLTGEFAGTEAMGERAGGFLQSPITDAVANVADILGGAAGQALYGAGQEVAGFFGENDAEKRARLAQEQQARIDEMGARGIVWDPTWEGRYQAVAEGLSIMQDGPLSYGDVVSAVINYDQQSRKTFSSVPPEQLMTIAQNNGFTPEQMVGVANGIDQANQLADVTNPAMVLKLSSDAGWRTDPMATFDYLDTRLSERGPSAYDRFAQSYGIAPQPLAWEDISRSPFFDAAQAAAVPGANEQALDFAAHISTQPRQFTPGLGSQANPVNEVTDLPRASVAPTAPVSKPATIKQPNLPNVSDIRIGAGTNITLPNIQQNPSVFPNSAPTGGTGGVGGAAGGITSRVVSTPQGPVEAKTDAELIRQGIGV